VVVDGVVDAVVGASSPEQADSSVSPAAASRSARLR